MGLLPDIVPPWVKLAAAGAAVATVAGAGAWTAHQIERPAHERAEARAAAAESGLRARAEEAKAQRGIDAAALDIVDHASRRAVDITVQGEIAAHAAEQAPGASDALPPDVLRSWAAGVDGVRDEARAARGAAAGPAGAGAVEPARPVPAPLPP